MHVSHPQRHVRDARQKRLVEVDAAVLHPERVETALLPVLICQGLTISAGTLADGSGRMLPLFEPLWGAILQHLNKAPLRHADETGWRIQSLREVRKSRRAWLWASLSKDAILFHRARSAEAAAKLFTDDPSS